MAGMKPGLVLFGTAPAAATPTPADEARRFRRNYDLIESVVQSSLDLAVVEDPVQRAHFCGKVARTLAQAIRQAAADREGERAAELSRHLRDQLKNGVAVNLTAASTVTPLGSKGEEDLRKVADDVNRIIQPLEDQLERSADAGTRENLRSTLQTIHDGRVEVDNVLKGREQK
jgi:hypothetical protein